jgi:outer membrane immunogenic protein
LRLEALLVIADANQKGVLMKRQLIAGFGLGILAIVPAMAADMRPAPAPIYTKAPMMAPPFTWTGCYVGGNGGGLWAKKDWTDSTTGLAESSVSLSGGVAGGQVGCNYQVSTWVFGIQGDYDWANASGSAADPTFAPDLASDGTKIKSLASVTGRVGYAWDRFLGYVKGGGAWVKDEYTATDTTFGLVSTASETRTGWTFGGGGEYAFTDWLTGFVEYDFYDFGTKTNSFAGSAGAFPIDIKQTVSVAKAGLNFKFGGWR